MCKSGVFHHLLHLSNLALTPDSSRRKGTVSKFWTLFCSLWHAGGCEAKCFVSNSFHSSEKCPFQFILKIARLKPGLISQCDCNLEGSIPSLAKQLLSSKESVMFCGKSNMTCQVHTDLKSELRLAMIGSFAAGSTSPRVPTIIT